MKYGSLVINTSTSFNCFTAETSFKMAPTIFQNGSETVIKKLKILCSLFGSSNFVQISTACGKHSILDFNSYLYSSGNVQELERKI